jgi:sodium/proline symporter
MRASVIPFVGDNIWALISCGLYFLVMVIIGLWAARFSSQGQANFLLGGRKMKGLVVGLSAVVSGRSAWLLLSVSGLAFIQGASAIWLVAGYTVAELIMFLTLGRKLRRDTESKGDLTIPDYLVSRFGDKGNLLRISAAGIIVVFMVTYVGAQIKAGGVALVAGFGLPDWQGVIITGAVILLYTAVGGFLAVSLTDVLQAFMMLISLVVLPVVAFLAFDSPGGILAALNPGSLDVFAIGAGALISALGIGFGSTGSPHILVRFMSVENENKLVFAGFISFFWNIVMGVGAVAIGVIGSAYYSLSQLPDGNREMIFPAMAGLLPPFIFGLVIASVFAAIMSTADSQLLVAASAAVRDFYQRTFSGGKSLDEKRMVLLNRLVVVALCVTGLLIGMFASQYVNFLVLLAWTGLGCSFGPVIILGLFWKQANFYGALAGILSGALTTFVWGLTPALKGTVHEVVPAFFASLLMTILVSLLTQEKE